MFSTTILSLDLSFTTITAKIERSDELGVYYVDGVKKTKAACDRAEAQFIENGWTVFSATAKG